MSVDSMLRKAGKLARSGDRAGAAALLRQVLAAHPGNRAAQAGLASLGQAAGVPGQTVPVGRPRPDPRALKGIEVALKRGDTGRAVAEAQRLALLFPDSAPVFNGLGLALARAGRMEEAAKAFARLGVLSPGNAGVQLNRGFALLSAGRSEAAAEAAAEALRLDPKLAPAAMLRGFALAQAGHWDAAEAAYRAAIGIAPKDPQGHLGLGKVLAATGRRTEALAAFETARTCDPANAEAPANIGAILIGLGRLDAAVAVLGPGAEAHPGTRRLRTTLAHALRDRGEPQRALDQIEAALDQGPQTAGLLALRGACLSDLGAAKAAAQAHAQARALEPDNIEALTLCWQTTPVPLDHPDCDRMAALVADAARPARERSTLAFALFAGHDAAGEIDRAAGDLAQANALRRAAAPYDIAAEARAFAALQQGFQGPGPVLAAADIARRPAGRRVVFIVGMPGSGTGLVEQILARHSQVHRAGPLRLLAGAMAEIGWQDSAIGRGPDRDSLRVLRRVYLEGLAQLDTRAPVVTDSMPLNFRSLGHALAALPEARALVLRRDPRAVCWANWSQGLRGRANDFAADMGNLARMYRMHLDLLATYRAAYPDRIAEVDCDRLTDDREAEIRALVAAAGLDWERACLGVPDTEAATRTPAPSPLSQGIDGGSPEDWRRYEAHLGPLLAGLDGLA